MAHLLGTLSTCLDPSDASVVTICSEPFVRGGLGARSPERLVRNPDPTVRGGARGRVDGRVERGGKPIQVIACVSCRIFAMHDSLPFLRCGACDASIARFLAHRFS